MREYLSITDDTVGGEARDRYFRGELVCVSSFQFPLNTEFSMCVSCSAESRGSFAYLHEENIVLKRNAYITDCAL